MSTCAHDNDVHSQHVHLYTHIDMFHMIFRQRGHVMIPSITVRIQPFQGKSKGKPNVSWIPVFKIEKKYDHV